MTATATMEAGGTGALPRFSPRREIGRTGFRGTAVGIGDLADGTLPFETCLATLRRALDAGLNVIDTAPAYENGLSERLVGAAVRERGRRDEVFVIDKIDVLDAPVGPQVGESLQRLGLAYADLFVFHGLGSLEPWRALAAPGGGFAQLAELVRAGKARFRGISAHHPEVLLAAIDSGLCDVVMMPVGPFVDARYLDEVLPRARAAGVGVVSFKTFGAGMLVADTSGYGRPLEDAGGAAGTSALPRPRLSVEDCVRFTLACDQDVALLGMSTAAEQDVALGAAAGVIGGELALPPADELAAIKARAAVAIAGKGKCWWNP